MEFLRSTIVISMCTLLSRILGFFRDVFFAKYLGTGSMSDVFFTAFRLPNFFRNIFAEGAFHSAFVPIFSSYLISVNSKEKMQDFLNNIFSLLLYSVLFFTLLAEIFMPQLINLMVGGFATDVTKYTLTVHLSRITFPYLIFISLISFMAGILNSYHKFFVVAINPVILNVVFIVSSLLSIFVKTNIVHLLSYAVIFGGLLQFICIFIATSHQTFRLQFGKIKMNAPTRKFMINFWSALLDAGIFQINSIILSLLVSRVAEALSYMYYADRLVQLPLALIGTALGISILPLLSEKIEQQKPERFTIQEEALSLAIFFGLPCAIYMHKLAHIFVPLLFERGAFSKFSSMAVVSCTKLYALALPAFILAEILQCIFFSHKDMRTPLILSLISLGVNGICSPFLVSYYSYRGAIVASVILAYLGLVLSFLILLLQKRLIFSQKFWRDLGRILIALLVFTVLLHLCCSNRFVADFVSHWKHLVVAIIIPGVGYLTMSYWLQVDIIYRYVRFNR